MIEDNLVESPLSEGLKDIKTIGRYEIIHKIGQGASGVVYKGQDPYINRSVAIKVSLPSSRKARERFFIEAQSAGRLNHPNIVSIYDAGEFNNYCYITMGYIDGKTLKGFCLHDKLLPVARTMELILRVCNALDYAHRNGVIHKDIKPPNIMLDKIGIVKITDFGIAQFTEQTAEKGIFGTPSYMSPEQIKDEIAVIPSDVFSLGCVMYEMLTGIVAFGGDNDFSIMYKIVNEDPTPILNIRPELPKIMGDIIKKALSKKFQDRYQTCLEFAYDLRLALRALNRTGNNEKLTDISEQFSSIPFFRNFTKQDISNLISINNIIKVKKGAVILSEGDIDDIFFIVLSGKVKIMRQNQTLAIIKQGESFGEMAYIGGQIRIATVSAETNCILLKIIPEMLDSAPVKTQILFYKNFSMTLVQRLSKATIHKKE